MSYREESMSEMYFGYAISGEKLTFTEVKYRFESDIQLANIRPIDELSSNQRKNLTIDCCNHDSYME